MGKRSVTVERAAKLLGLSRGSIYRRIADGSLETRPGPVAANGKQVRLVILPGGGGPTLARRGLDAGGESVSPTDAPALPVSSPAALPALPFPNSPPLAPGRVPMLANGQVDLPRLAPGHRRRYEIQRDALARYDALRDQGMKAGVAQARVAGEIGCKSTRAIRYWLRHREESGLSGLVPQDGRPPGSTKLPVELQRKILAKYLDRRKPPVSQVMRELVLPWYLERQLDPPHRGVVDRFLRQRVLPVEEIAFRAGPASFRGKMQPKVHRDPSTIGPNDLWTTDERILDVLVGVGDGRGTGHGEHGKRACLCGSGKPRGECHSLVRYVMTGLFDVASGFWLAYRLGITGTRAGFHHVLRKAIASKGVPRSLYMDNGKTFIGGKRVPRGEPVESELMSALDILGIRATPFWPWSKVIEGYFSAMPEWERGLPGYCGSSPAERPEILASQLARGQYLLDTEFVELLDKYVRWWNEEHIIGSERTKPPSEYYRDFTPRLADPGALAYLCQHETTRIVRADGVNLRGYRYFSPALAIYTGCRVGVRYDLDDPSVAYVYPPHAAALAVPLALKASYVGWGEANLEAKRGLKLQRALLAHTRDQIAGALTDDEADPTGAIRLITDRAERVKLEAADRAAAEQQRAAQELAEAEQARERETAELRERAALRAAPAPEPPAEPKAKEESSAVAERLRGAALLAQYAPVKSTRRDQRPLIEQWCQICFDYGPMRQDLQRLSRADAHALRAAHLWPLAKRPLLDDAAAAAESHLHPDISPAGDVVVNIVLMLVEIGQCTFEGELTDLRDAARRIDIVRDVIGRQWRSPDRFAGANEADLEVLARYGLLPCTGVEARLSASRLPRERRA
jgi:hypothetical protein